jgi:hypothetical protein
MFASIIRWTMGTALLLCFGYLSGAALADEPKLKASGVIPVTLVGAFSDVDRAKMLRAINEWNFALNGKLHFELLADANQSPMAASYRRDQNCVDYPAMALVAGLPHLELREFKECGDTR